MYKDKLKNFISEIEPEVMEYMTDMKHQCMHNINVCHATKEMLETLYIAKQLLKDTEQTDTFNDILATNNLKWIIYCRLADEIQDANYDIKVSKKALSHGHKEIAEKFKILANQKIQASATINDIYIDLPYTHGTAQQQAKWNKEYAEIIEQHKDNIKNINL